ncbi:MAG: TRAP transporter substrate-binding protein DctP [Gemmobacter sp.]
MTGLTLTRRLFCAAAAAAFALPALAADVTLRVGWTTSDGPQDPYAITARALAAALEAEAPGVFALEFFPNRQLGDEKEMLEGLGFGTLDLAIITNAVIANVEPAFQLNDLPFLYGSAEQAHAVLDGEIGQELLGRLSAHGVVGLGFAEGGFRNMINNTRPVTAPEDVGGVKYRVMQNPVFIEMFGSLGGNAVPMSWGEVYTAVQQGTIDGLEIPVAVVDSGNFAEVVRYLSLTRHTYSALGVLMSERAHARLSADQRAALHRAAARAIAEQRAEVAANDAAIIARLQERGMQVNEIDDPAAFRAMVGGVYEMFRGGIGADLMDRALAAVN